MPNSSEQNGPGPWWSRLGAVGIAMAGIVYLGESLGGRFLDLIAADLQAERELQRQVVRALEQQAIASKASQRHLEALLEINRERNRILQRQIEELRENRRDRAIR